MCFFPQEVMTDENIFVLFKIRVMVSVNPLTQSFVTWVSVVVAVSSSCWCYFIILVVCYCNSDSINSINYSSLLALFHYSSSLLVVFIYLLFIFLLWNIGSVLPPFGQINQCKNKIQGTYASVVVPIQYPYLIVPYQSILWAFSCPSSFKYINLKVHFYAFSS